jgi:hypothetical protein
VPKSEHDKHAAIREHLAGKRITLQHAEPDEASGETNVSGEVWHPISVPGFDALQDLHVALPVQGRVTVGPKNAVQLTALSQPSSEEVAEAAAFVKSLATHGQIEGVGTKAASKPTHRIETDEEGRRRLVRKGFSAV